MEPSAYIYTYIYSQRLIDECPGDGDQYTSILRSQCSNMNFSCQIIYERMFRKLLHNGRGSEINYIKIFKNYKALAISVVNTYTEDRLMHTSLENLKKI